MFFPQVANVPNDVNLSGKTTIVTGSSVGIGSEIAKQLFLLGADVTLACRSADKAEKTIEEIKKGTPFFPGGSLEFIRLDLADTDSVRQFADQFGGKHKNLHLLVNNAGFIDLNASKNAKGIDSTIAVNHLGPTLLTHLLLDKLRSAYKDSGEVSRIVFLSSTAHYSPGSFDLNDITLTKMDKPKPTTYDSFMKYGISKQQNAMIARAIADQEKDNGIISLSVHPGVVNSEFGSQFKGILGFFAKPIMSVLGRTNKDGAASALFASIAPEVVEKRELYTGAYLDSDGKIKAPSKQTQDLEACKELLKGTMALFV